MVLNEHMMLERGPLSQDLLVTLKRKQQIFFSKSKPIHKIFLVNEDHKRQPYNYNIQGAMKKMVISDLLVVDDYYQLTSSAVVAAVLYDCWQLSKLANLVVDCC